MSENHTYIPSELYREMTNELDELRSGRGSNVAMENALASARTIFEQITQRGIKLDQKISNQRRTHLNNLRDIENQSIQRHIQTLSGINQTAENIQQINTRIQESLNQVNRISTDIATQYSTSEELYRQVQVEFNAVNVEADYHRFAHDRMENLESAIKRISITEMSPVAKNAQLQSAMSDLLLIDSIVASERIKFYNSLSDALNLSASMLADAAGHRSNTYRYGSEQHPASDMDYWTDGQYTIFENELKSIRERLESAPINQDYSMKDLENDRKSLRELKQIQKLLAASTITKIKLSDFRHQQADFINGILSQDFLFQLITEGFDRGDERESYIVRMERESDKAIVEVIVSPGIKDGEVNTVVRVDNTAFADSKLRDTLENQILEDLRASGMEVKSHAPCNSETIDRDAPVEISDETRRTHDIPQRTQLNVNAN